MLVVDASCAVKWFAPEEGWPAARRLLGLGRPLLAPDILAVETMNALLRKHRRREVLEEVPATALHFLASLPVESVAHPPLLREAVMLAQRHRHALYDCLYLIVAQRRGAALATFDRRLALLAERLAVPLWSPDAVQDTP